jgi:hypothetical protein
MSAVHRLGDEVAAHPPRHVRGTAAVKKNHTWAPFPERERSIAMGTLRTRQVSAKAATSSFHELLSKSAARNQPAELDPTEVEHLPAPERVACALKDVRAMTEKDAVMVDGVTRRR